MIDMKTILAFGLGAVLANNEYRKAALSICDGLVKNGSSMANKLMKSNGVDIDKILSEIKDEQPKSGNTDK